MPNTQLTLSLGSNIDAPRNIRSALNSLTQRFGPLRLSSVYESEAVGFKGDNFLNLVAVTNTDLSLIVVQEYLKYLEISQGRDRQQEKFSSRPIDVDILTFGDSDGSEIGITLPRPEITRNAFVLLPLAELLPEQIHPPTKRSYAELWADYDKSSQRLWPVSLD